MQDPLYISVFMAVFVGVTGLSFAAGRKVRSSDDFSLSGRSLGAAGVSWVIIGTLVGGAATIGTVQMAFLHGFSAWYFTLGSGLACLVLGLCFARSLRESETVTVAEYLGSHFGAGFQVFSSTFSSLGMLMQVVAQYLAALALLKAIFGFSNGASIGITFVMIVGFVVAGGMTGAGLIGKLKFYLLCVMLLLSAGICLHRAGGPLGLLGALRTQGVVYGFWAGGRWPALMDILSMVVGVLSTQIYLQAVFSARTVREARNGALLSAALIPPMGLLGIVIGLYLRVSAPELTGHSAQALPYFLNTTYPPVIAALFSAGLLVIVVGTGSGLVLGVSTNVFVDFVSRVDWLRRQWTGVALIRAGCLAVLMLSVALVFFGLNSTILQWSYVSMGLRGTAVFAGLCLAVFAKGRPWLGKVRPVLFLLPPAYLLVVFLRQ